MLIRVLQHKAGGLLCGIYFFDVGMERDGQEKVRGVRLCMKHILCKNRANQRKETDQVHEQGAPV